MNTFLYQSYHENVTSRIWRMCACACVCVCARMRTCVCRACVHTCKHVYVYTRTSRNGVLVYVYSGVYMCTKIEDVIRTHAQARSYVKRGEERRRK